MKKVAIGYALVIIGIIMFAYTGINFMPNKKAVDIGPIKIYRKESHPVLWSPFIGIALVVGGIVLVGPVRKIKKLKPGSQDSGVNNSKSKV